MKIDVKEFFRPTMMRFATAFLFFAFIQYGLFAVVDVTIPAKPGILGNLMLMIILVTIWIIIPYLLACIAVYGYKEFRQQ